MEQNSTSISIVVSLFEILLCAGPRQAATAAAVKQSGGLANPPMAVASGSGGICVAQLPQNETVIRAVKTQFAETIQLPWQQQSALYQPDPIR